MIWIVCITVVFAKAPVRKQLKMRLSMAWVAARAQFGGRGSGHVTSALGTSGALHNRMSKLTQRKLGSVFHAASCRAAS